jgi:pimeloyl-ACP methyl ester carboxylesterase
MSNPGELEILTTDRVRLSGEDSNPAEPDRSRPAIVLLHGLTATRRYVVMGSRMLERSGHRVIAYDARGHGRSSPAGTPDAYGYELLARDLRALLDDLQIERAVLAGASMGAHTAVRFALEHPDAVAALALITPAYDPDTSGSPAELERWDMLAEGLEQGGVDEFISAYDLDAVDDRWRGTIATVLRQRLQAHEHPGALADALRAVPRSRAFEDMAQLHGIRAPTVVVASRDEADPGHPLAIGESYARAIPGARLVVEEISLPPRSPIAWQGGQLSRVVADLTTEVSM